MPRDLRLQKFMADAGVASRRKSEEYISAGRVQINGRRASLGDKVDAKKDLVTLDGEAIGKSEKKYYIMLHKPRGFVTTMNDEKGRKCVADLIKNIPARLYPVGRLDKDSEGLLLMTNDGNFAQTVSHPASHVSKLYRVSVKPAVSEDQVTKMATGIVIDGVKTQECNIRVTSNEPGRSVMDIVLTEGRNRQIRKMCEAVGLEVLRLKRKAIGPVKLGMLPIGQYRELGKDEVRRIAEASLKRAKKESENDRNNTDKRPTKRGRDTRKTTSRRR